MGKTLANAAYDYLATGQYALAEQAARQLLLQPENCGDALCLLASIYIETNQQEPAEKTVRELVALRPGNAYALFLQARVQFMAGARLSVLHDLKAVLQSNRKIAPAVQEKIYNLLGQCCRWAGDSRHSCKAYRRAAELADSLELKRLEYSNYLFNLHYRDDVAEENFFRAHAAYDTFCAKCRPFFHYGRRAAGEKLRIGYISADFRNHVVLRFSYALLQYYNRNRYAVFCYMRGAQDEMSRQVAALPDVWRDIQGVTAAQAARIIYDDGIDILFDLSGHTQNSCLPVLAYKPAPVQISGIGYMSTTGLQTVDYFLSDVYLDADGQDESLCFSVKEETARMFTEQLLLLPHSHFCYTPLYKTPAPQNSACRANQYVTFGSFNAYAKLTDTMLLVWKRILDRVPRARLLLKGEIFDREEGRVLVEGRLERLGFDKSQFELRAFSTDYLSTYQEVDIALDTYPYPGGGTTLDALYMGIPVITLVGQTHRSRFGYSILMNAGLAELCTFSLAEYEDRAVALADDIELLQALHRQLRPMLEQSPLMDGKRYMQDMERLYQKIWLHYCTGQAAPSAQEICTLRIRMHKLAQAGDWKQAGTMAGCIMAARPEDRTTLEQTAEIYIDAGNAAGAVAVADHLLQTQGTYGYGLFLAARAAFLQGDWEKTQAYGYAALKKGDLESWQSGMAHDILGRISKEAGSMEAAAQHHLAASKRVVSVADQTASYSNYLFDMQYREASETVIYEAACWYETFFQNIDRFDHAHHEDHEKLRIGYISPDLCAHITAWFSWAFFQSYDHDNFEVYCYANCPEDAISKSFAAMTDHWHNLMGMTAEQAARLIYEEEIDILVDLAGHTKGNCLPVMAYKPAPVQVSGIGYMSTTGLSAIDYFFSDVYLAADDALEKSDLVGLCCEADHLEPHIAATAGFKEKLLVLPHSHFCYRPYTAPACCREAPFQSNRYITFGCFNQFAKLTDDLLHVWGTILLQVPESRLFLKAAVFDHAYGRQVAEKRLAAAGIPLDRVITEGYTADYLDAYNRVDIALDTWPYVGGGTTCDALYMGVPVITLIGRRHGARFGYSLLMNIQLAECCASSLREYIKRAVDLANNPARLKQLHQILRRRMQESPVMDQGLYMGDIETAYRKIWYHWRLQNESPDKAAAFAKKCTIRLMAALPHHQWEYVVRDAGRLYALGSGDAKVLSAAGLAYLERKDYNRAAFWLRRAIRTDRENAAELYMMLGEALHQSVRHVEAHNAYDAAWEAVGSQVTPELRLQILLKKAYSANIRGLSEEAAAAYRQAFVQAEGQDIKDRCNMYSSWLLSLHATNIGETELAEAHAGYARIFSAVQPYEHNGHAFHKKLRIGYLSPDYRQHVMFAFYYVLLAGYDKKRFDIYCYSLSTQRDAYTERVQNLAGNGWRDVSGRAYDEIAQCIYADEIDILVDLAGHTANSGLPVLAWKPAPVQVSGLGYMHVTGLPQVDWFITDAWCDPSGGGAMQSAVVKEERRLYLTSQFCYSARSNVPDVSGAPCQQRGYVLFGVFNHYYKITDEMLLAWLKILQRVPESRILFKCQALVSQSVVDVFDARLRQLGFDIDRVLFEPATVEYMSRYLDIDIALDTYPYPGGGTTCDALYMGVPVVSRFGQRRGSRFGKSLLESVGIGELAVDTLDAYVDQAAALARDSALLDALHRQLRGMMRKSPLMDVRHYMQELESRYEEIWQDWRQQRRKT